MKNFVIFQKKYNKNLLVIFLEYRDSFLAYIGTDDDVGCLVSMLEEYSTSSVARQGLTAGES
jgi:hypothetical protein